MRIEEGMGCEAACIGLEWKDSKKFEIIIVFYRNICISWQGKAVMPPRP